MNKHQVLQSIGLLVCSMFQVCRPGISASVGWPVSVLSLRETTSSICSFRPGVASRQVVLEDPFLVALVEEELNHGYQAKQTHCPLTAMAAICMTTQPKLLLRRLIVQGLGNTLSVPV